MYLSDAADAVTTGAVFTDIYITPHEGEEHVDVETYPVRNEQGKISYLIEIMRETHMASSRVDAYRMVGRSPAFNRMLALINRVAPAERAVLLQGESGYR